MYAYTWVFSKIKSSWNYSNKPFLRRSRLYWQYIYYIESSKQKPEPVSLDGHTLCPAFLSIFVPRIWNWSNFWVDMGKYLHGLHPNGMNHAWLQRQVKWILIHSIIKSLGKLWVSWTLFRYHSITSDHQATFSEKQDGFLQPTWLYWHTDVFTQGKTMK